MTKLGVYIGDGLVVEQVDNDHALLIRDAHQHYPSSEFMLSPETLKELIEFARSLPEYKKVLDDAT